MELSVIKEPELVIALDVGSICCGYAWQTRDEFLINRNEIHLNANWGTGALQLSKTASSILIEMPVNIIDILKVRGKLNLSNNDQVKVTIGHSAENVYSNYCKVKPDEMKGRKYFFSKFKKDLFRKDFHCGVEIADHAGQMLPLFEVMSLFIKGLKDHCLQKLQTMGVGVDLDKTLFVETVPGILSEEGKQFMREAAVQAGIGKRNILLALESEVAAIYCLSLPESLRKDMFDLGIKGKKFLVAKLGGDIAEFSAVRENDDGKLEELCPPFGEVVNTPDISEASLQAWDLNEEGDQKGALPGTSNVRHDNTDRVENGGTHSALYCPRSKPVGNETKQNRAIKSNNRLSDFQPNMFIRTCSEYSERISKILKVEKDLILIILVGGLCESPIIVQTLRRQINNVFPDVKVVATSSPVNAILKGAVLFGHDPMIFGSRISRLTFGIDTSLPFDDTKHDPNKKWVTEESGAQWCKDIFSVHVRKDQSVVLNSKQPSGTYIPAYKNQTELGLPIYSSIHRNPKYVTDEGCKQIGKVTVKLPEESNEHANVFNVTMIYGGTQLSVIVTNKETGQEYDAVIQLSNTI